MRHFPLEQLPLNRSGVALVQWAMAYEHPYEYELSVLSEAESGRAEASIAGPAGRKHFAWSSRTPRRLSLLAGALIASLCISQISMYLEVRRLRAQNAKVLLPIIKGTDAEIGLNEVADNPIDSLPQAMKEAQRLLSSLKTQMEAYKTTASKHQDRISSLKNKAEDSEERDAAAIASIKDRVDALDARDVAALTSLKQKLADADSRDADAIASLNKQLRVAGTRDQGAIASLKDKLSDSDASIVAFQSKIQGEVQTQKAATQYATTLLDDLSSDLGATKKAVQDGHGALSGAVHGHHQESGAVRGAVEKRLDPLEKDEADDARGITSLQDLIKLAKHNAPRLREALRTLHGDAGTASSAYNDFEEKLHGGMCRFCSSCGGVYEPYGTWKTGTSITAFDEQCEGDAALRTVIKQEFPLCCRADLHI